MLHSPPQGKLKKHTVKNFDLDIPGRLNLSLFEYRAILTAEQTGILSDVEKSVAKEHELEKLRLDNLMLEAESETAKERLFSKERDYPFLDKYEKFVRTSSKKDGQNIFTEEY